MEISIMEILCKTISFGSVLEALNEVKQALGALGYTSFRYGQHAVTSRIVSGE